eukprot:scaffold721_cov131-Cylindrotheca_fusiformis.AAC.62
MSYGEKYESKSPPVESTGTERNISTAKTSIHFNTLPPVNTYRSQQRKKHAMSPVLMQDQHMNSFIGSRRDHESPQHDKESPRQSSYRRLFPNRYGPLIPPKRSFPPASMATSVSCNDIPYQNNRMETLLRPQHAEFREKPVSLLPALLNEQGHIPEKGTFCAGATREPPENLPSQSPQAVETERQSDRSEDVGHGQKGNVRRCLSSKELRTENPLSGSPYSYMLYQKEQISARMTQRLKETLANPPPRVFSDDSSGSSLGGPLNNKARNQRRAEHNRAITNELCEIVTDLFVAESKLINPSSYGVDSAQKREQVMRSVERFVGSLPPRYALSAETPSEVLLHMRLAAAVRANPTRAVVHITNIENGSHWAKSSEAGHNIKLVTIACSDANGLLEYMTKTLASDGSRVLDADVMLSSDSIVLDRFIVEMQGRLRLDKLSKCIEYFLQQTKRRSDSSASELPPEERSDSVSSDASRCHSENSGAVYFRPSPSRKDVEIQEEIKTAVPLSEIVAIGSSSAGLSSLHLTSTCLPLSRHLSIPRSLQAPAAYSPGKPGTVKTKASEDGSNVGDNNPDETIPKNIVTTDPDVALNEEIRIKEISDDRLVIEPRSPPQMRYNRNFDFEMNKAVYSSPRENQKRQLVKRSGNSDFDAIGNREISGDMLAYDHAISNALYRTIPMIPFDELMLIETLGMGRVSTIYRAAWRQKMTGDQYPDAVNSQMLALKVAIVNSGSYDTSHVDELRREADIAARLKHPNICDLKGVAADSE